MTSLWILENWLAFFTFKKQRNNCQIYQWSFENENNPFWAYSTLCFDLLLHAILWDFLNVLVIRSVSMDAESLHIALIALSLWTEGWCYCTFLSNNLDSHVGTSLVRLGRWLTATEVWAADCAGCHSAEGKHQAHCHDYHFNPGARVAEVTYDHVWLCCQWTDYCRCTF